MLHDEEVYPDPFKFKPERFMKDGKLAKDVRDPGHACWGFGRRYVSHLSRHLLHRTEKLNHCSKGSVLGVTWHFQPFGLL